MGPWGTSPDLINIGGLGLPGSTHNPQCWLLLETFPKHLSSPPPLSQEGPISPWCGLSLGFLLMEPTGSDREGPFLLHLSECQLHVLLLGQKKLGGDRKCAIVSGTPTKFGIGLCNLYRRYISLTAPMVPSGVGSHPASPWSPELFSDHLLI